MNNLKVAITGANGYIGSFLTSFFRKKGCTVYEMVRKSTSTNQENFIFFALGKKNDYSQLKQMDVLIHCAYDFSSIDYETSRITNVKGSIELFEQAKKMGVKKIIYLSSTSSFADAVSNYGKIKFEIEQLAKPLNVITIRPGLVFSRNAGGIVGALNKLASKLPVIPLVGKGKQLFYPCHIEDLANLIYTLSTAHIMTEDIPIVAASEQFITFKQIILTLAAVHQRKIVLLPLPYSLIFLGLRLAELGQIKLGLRSDSLKYMKYYNQSIDFTATRKLAVSFRPFTVQTFVQ